MKIFPNIHTLKKASYKKCVNGFIPRTVLIPLSQDFEDECKPLVKSGDVVKEGSLIGESDFSSKRGFPLKIYSPIPGTVKDIELCVCPNGRVSRAVRINLGGSFSFLGKKNPPNDYTLFTRTSLIREIAEKGILNSFYSFKPTLLADDLKNASKETNPILVVRLFDEDSSRLTDSLLSRLYINEIMKGSFIASKALGATGIIFACEKDFEKPKEFSDDEESVKKQNVPFSFVAVNQKKYPSGYRNQLLSSCRSFFKKEPFSSVQKNSLFTDSSTMLELYRTITFGFPSIERYVLVSGECLHATGLIKVVIGTTLKELSEECGGFVKEPGAILINGYVSGFSVANLSVPITKYVKSVAFIPKRKVPDQRMSVCVNCGSCRRVCPEKLSPDIIYKHITENLDVYSCYKESAKFCSNCVLCNSTCPARLPLSQIIYAFGKKQNDEKGSGSK